MIYKVYANLWTNDRNDSEETTLHVKADSRARAAEYVEQNYIIPDDGAMEISIGLGANEDVYLNVWSEKGKKAQAKR